MDDKDYQVPFAFTGKLAKISIDLGDTSATPEAIKLMMEDCRSSATADSNWTKVQ